MSISPMALLTACHTRSRYQKKPLVNGASCDWNIIESHKKEVKVDTFRMCKIYFIMKFHGVFFYQHRLIEIGTHLIDNL